MQFDELGNLFPYKIIEIDLEAFEDFFVTNFPKSDSRQKLFKNYISYVNSFKSQVNCNFYQWIDGSFVTTKQNPNDIDIVTFLNFEVYENNVTQIADFQGYKVKNEQYLDCYFVKEYPTEHKNYEIITHYDSVEWFHLFSKTRVQRNGKRYSKGIIKINF